MTRAAGRPVQACRSFIETEGILVPPSFLALSKIPLTKRSRKKIHLPTRRRAHSRLGHEVHTQDRNALVVFARSATSGKAKTRLGPLLGRRGAAEFQAALIADTIRKGNSLQTLVVPYFFLAGRHFPFLPALSDFTLARQRGADLGERLQRAFARLLSRHDRVVVIGTDSPTLPLRVLRQTFRELRVCDAVLGPCPDGGFYLVGLRRGALSQGLFSGVGWGSAFAFRDMLQNLLGNNRSCSILEPFADVDRPQDVQRLMKELAQEAKARRLSPTVWRFLEGLHTRKNAAEF